MELNKGSNARLEEKESKYVMIVYCCGGKGSLSCTAKSDRV
jgi:hypothetical protein